MYSKTRLLNGRSTSRRMSPSSLQRTGRRDLRPSLLLDWYGAIMGGGPERANQRTDSHLPTQCACHSRDVQWRREQDSNEKKTGQPSPEADRQQREQEVIRRMERDLGWELTPGTQPLTETGRGFGRAIDEARLGLLAAELSGWAGKFRCSLNRKV
jgi:hypothetical protein